MLERVSWRFLYSFFLFVCLCWGVTVGFHIKEDPPQSRNGDTIGRAPYGSQLTIQAQRNTTNNVIVNNKNSRGGGWGGGGGGGGGGWFGWGWGGGGGGGGGWGWGKGGGGCDRGANNKGERGRLGGKKKERLSGYGVFNVGEYARCMEKGPCKGMKLICPLHCRGPCFYDCVKFCRPRCKH